MLFCILNTKKKWLSVVKGLSDAHIKVDACIKVYSYTKDDAAWHGMKLMTMWHEFEIIVAL